MLTALICLMLLSCSTASSDRFSTQTHRAPSHDKGNHSKQLLERETSLYCESDLDCLPWTACKNNTCTCDLHAKHWAKCNKDFQLSVLKCHCVTYDETTGEMFAGACIENCENHHKELYLPLPIDYHAINKTMCGDKWNRAGQLCGKCKPEHAPLAFSYDMRCEPCEEGKRNLWKYFLVALGPLTVFYFIVLFFKVNATSSHLHGFMMFSQAVSMPAFVRVALMSEHKTNLVLFRIMLSFYSLWNLDILRGVYPNICLDVSTLTILALEYIVALYPLALIIISYILIKLHDRNCRVIVFIWRPFRYVFTFFRRNWDVRSTVTDTYATFFLLSFMKILGTSGDLLTPTRVYNIRTGKHKFVVYYDGSVQFLRREHLPYAIPALILLLLFSVLPTLLLLLYPFRWFQSLLNRLNLRSRMLHVVMDSFQGYYKDGTAGTRDCRWFAAIPLIGCYMLIVIFGITRDSTYFPIASTTVVFLIILTVLADPFNRIATHYVKSDTFFLGLIAILYGTISANNHVDLLHSSLSHLTHAIILLTGGIPVIYITCITLYWIVSRMQQLRTVVRRARAWNRGYQNIESARNDDDLPDRLVNPERNYEESDTEVH